MTTVAHLLCLLKHALPWLASAVHWCSMVAGRGRGRQEPHWRMGVALSTGASSGARIEARQGPPLVLCSTQNQEASSKLARGWRPAAVCVRCSLMRCAIAGGWGGAGRWRLAGLVVVRFVWWGSASDVGHQAVAGWEKPIGVWTVASGSLPGRKAMTWVMSSGIWR
jgi:hypothetical protein